MRELETRFVNGESVNDRRLSQLEIMIVISGLKCALRQSESADTAVLRGEFEKVVASDQRVL